MARYRLFLLAGCVGLGLNGGCGIEPQYQSAVRVADQAAEQICTSNMDKPQAMRVAEDVLTEMHFTIEKVDLDGGLIRTRPLPGAQFFEFWRSDNVGPCSAALANLHSIQRAAEVHIQRQGDKLCIRCNVRIHKLNLPEHGPGRAGAPVKRLTLTPEQEIGMTWMDLGKDRSLATEILKRIEKQVRNSKSEARNNIKIQMSK